MSVSCRIQYQMKPKDSHNIGEGKILKTLRSDLGRGDFKRSVRREFRELKDVMFDDQRKSQLTDMSAWKRWFLTGWWLFKSMFFKLTPARRILLVAGILLVIGSRTVVFSNEHVRVSSDTNGLGALCILFVLMLELKDKLIAKKELEAGRAVQEALMPDRNPDVPGWELFLFSRPANEVGGDLVDYITLEDARFGITLADVSGKGLSAALLAAKLQATLRALAPGYVSLGELGSRLNQIVCRDNLKNYFASLLYFEVQHNSGDVRVLNAGHPPPLLIKGHNVETMEKGGVALGIMSDGIFAEQRINLNIDEFIVAYSDGLTEAQNESGEFFGDERLFELSSSIANLSAEETGKMLFETVDRFVGEARVHDDLSIVVLRRVQNT